MLEDLEKFLKEIITKFEELAVPIMSFLDGHWQSRITEYISAHDLFDEGHVRNARAAGIDLVAEETPAPEWVKLLFGV
jgi:hypothetical protein